MILVLGHERYKGGTRVRFVCGHRALAAVHARLHALDRAGALLSSAPEGVADAAARAVERLAATEKRARDLQERALEGEARRLLGDAAQPPVDGPQRRPTLVVATYEGWPPDDLRVLAQCLTTLAPCVALLANRVDKAHLVFAQSPGLGHDIPGLLRRAVEQVGGRGGGRGDLAQGGGERMDALAGALAEAATAVMGDAHVRPEPGGSGPA
jgi:alanyl-tRNA synthetase